LEIQVLLLVGECEILYPAPRAVQRAQEWIPNLQARLIPGSGHFLGAGQLEAVNGCPARFFEEPFEG
jgi:hypothetical protein